MSWIEAFVGVIIFGAIAFGAVLWFVFVRMRE